MNIKNDIKFLPVIAALTFIVFSNSLGGTFVYDDVRQVQGNILIQDTSLIGKALTSDVWAFKGDGAIAASNYWRPTFTAWCILNYKLFGQTPYGWHLLNIFLHIGVCLTAFLLLRRWGISQWIAFGITLIYAVHPIHSESVAWIAGSPDLLFGIFFLGSLWFAESSRQEKNRNLNLALSLVLFCLALGAKEIAFLCLPVYYFIFHREKDGDKREALGRVIPFALAGAAWFIVRWIILGRLSQPAEDAPDTVSAILSAPAVFVFYLKQTFFPYWLGINYSLRPVEQIGFGNFVLPLLITIGVLAAIWWLARRSWVQALGAALFLLPLILSFNIGAFPAEQIVHDRYLYLPLLGFLMLVAPFFGDIAERFAAERSVYIVAGLMAVLSVPLAVRTYSYNRVWFNEAALWKNAVKVDPNSAFNWSQLGAVYDDDDEIDQALDANERSLAIKETPLALIGKGRALVRKDRYEEALPAFRKVIETDSSKINAYTLFQGYEALAISLQGKPDLPEAEKILRQARERLPIYRAALTDKLAIVIFLQYRAEDALKELEAVKGQARIEMLPASKAVFLRLGMVYDEMGRPAEARANLQEFLAWTQNTRESGQLADRYRAKQILDRLK